MADQNAYNVGSDTKITVLSNGLPLGATILTSFEARQVTTRLKSLGIDGVARNRELEEGWEGSLKWDRADALLDDFFAAKEAARYAGLQPPTLSITETTVNASDGTTSRYRYDGVTLKMDSAGAREGDKKVEQSASWAASRRIKVA